jgi:hypothetical protein
MRSLMVRLPVLLVLALATPALASDGVLEINQTCAVQTGCFAGDTASVITSKAAIDDRLKTGHREPSGTRLRGDRDLAQLEASSVRPDRRSKAYSSSPRVDRAISEILGMPRFRGKSIVRSGVSTKSGATSITLELWLEETGCVKLSLRAESGACMFVNSDLGRGR